MNNLQSLKSQLIVDYSEKEIQEWRRKNFYQHHNLPLRSTLKTRQSSSKMRSHSNLLTLTSKKRSTHDLKLPNYVHGRKLFQDLAKLKIPGPGSYQYSSVKYPTHCYIKKEEEFVKAKIAKKLRRRQLIDECRGPGIYNPQLAFNHTSKSKSQLQGKMSESFFTRCILPEANKESLYLTSTFSERFFRKSDTPSPQKYNTLNARLQVSNESRSISHLISMTARSSIIKPEAAPAPGFYKLARQFEPSPKTPGKAKIQYKFVYGHPS